MTSTTSTDVSPTYEGLDLTVQDSTDTLDADFRATHKQALEICNSLTDGVEKLGRDRESMTKELNDCRTSYEWLSAEYQDSVKEVATLKEELEVLRQENLRLVDKVADAEGHYQTWCSQLHGQERGEDGLGKSGGAGK